MYLLPSDKQLILLAKAGDEKAIADLAEKAIREVIPFLLWQFHQSITLQDAEDAFQKVMVYFLENPLSVKATTDKEFLNWVKKSCKNKILDLIKSSDYKMKRQPFFKNKEGEEIELEFRAPESVEDIVIGRELIEEINLAIKKLNEVDQKIIHYYLNGYRLFEIAEEVGLTKDNTRKRKSRAVEKLGNILKREKSFFKLD